MLQDKELYHALIESMNEGLGLVDEKGMAIYANDQCCEILGYPKSEIVGKHWMSVWDETARKFIEEQLKRRRKGVAEPYEVENTRKDGRKVVVRVSPRPILDEGGNFKGSIALFQDVTERVRAEEALRESEARYRSLTELSPDAIFVHSEGKVVFANLATAKLIGASNSEALIGMPVTAFVAPEYREIVEDRWRRIGEGKSVEFIEERLIRLDGQSIDAEIGGSPFTYHGKPAVLVVARDITRRKQIEQALRQRTDQLEALRQIGLNLTAQLDLETLLHSVASRAVELLGGTDGGIYLYRPERDVLEWAVVAGPNPAPIGTILRRGEGAAGKVWETGDPLIVNDYQNWEGRAAVSAGRCAYEGYHFTSLVDVPVRWRNQFLGVLNVNGDPARTFSQADIELLEMFAAQAAIAIRNAYLLRAEREHRELVERLFEQIRRDAETRKEQENK